MGSTRVWGIILLGFGVLLTALAGLWLATEANTSALSSGDVFLRAFIAFVFIIPVILLGIYLLAKNNTSDDANDDASDVVQQRRLLDTLRTRQRATFAELSHETGMSEAEITTQLEALMQLSIFSGYVQWSSGYAVVMPSQQLLHLKQCAHCQQAIIIKPETITSCSVCNTQYCTV